MTLALYVVYRDIYYRHVSLFKMQATVDKVRALESVSMI